MKAKPEGFIASNHGNILHIRCSPSGFITSNHGKILRIPWFLGGYSYSNVTNYFKMNNYCKFYGKTFIVTRAIMNDNRELQGYAVFYP